jgi:glutamyl-tRNA synthetase
MFNILRSKKFLYLSDFIMSENVRTRFAPSPTGYLHVGGLRTALYNLLFARHHHGQMILRIEDTDRTRYMEGASENLIKILHAMGIDYQEGPDIGGDDSPYVQSQRLALYREHARQLIEQGDAYYCFCTAERLEEMRRQQEAKKQQPKYDGTCRQLSKQDIEQKLASGISHVIRLKMPGEGVTRFKDIIRGEISVQNELTDDQILVKSDNYPTYHLANVVDDHHMRITHVIRGEEWLLSVPKHIRLYQAFGWDIPQMAHLPLLLNPDRTKLSKRQGDVAVEDFLEKGYIPAGM